jgi:hypothetical protein
LCQASSYCIPDDAQSTINLTVLLLLLLLLLLMHRRHADLPDP